ncbi:MAG: hypothetical protein LKF36_01905 [Lactobacillus sp.]|jgi:hypothetical protein|nr:hypothetical protein [Lactobacillus sp.]
MSGKTNMLNDNQQLNDLLETAKKIPTSELLDHALYEKYPAKKAVFKALYEYVIDERQSKIIQQKHFTI